MLQLRCMHQGCQCSGSMRRYRSRRQIGNRHARGRLIRGHIFCLVRKCFDDRRMRRLAEGRHCLLSGRRGGIIIVWDRSFLAKSLAGVINDLRLMGNTIFGLVSWGSGITSRTVDTDECFHRCTTLRGGWKGWDLYIRVTETLEAWKNKDGRIEAHEMRIRDKHTILLRLFIDASRITPLCYSKD